MSPPPQKVSRLVIPKIVNNTRGVPTRMGQQSCMHKHKILYEYIFWAEPSSTEGVSDCYT